MWAGPPIVVEPVFSADYGDDVFGWLTTSEKELADVEWVLDACDALLPRVGKEAPLVLPTDEFYPVDREGDDDIVERMFELTVEHAGLQEWPIRLVLEGSATALDALGRLPHGGAEGAVSSGLRFDTKTEPPTYLVTYVRDDVRTPEGFIYHCATQLAAALVWDIEEVPGGDEAFWFFVDVVLCFMGFGVFACNASFIYERYTDGEMAGAWHQHRGALSLPQMAAALAVFAMVNGIPQANVRAHLSANPRAAFKKAVRILEKHFGDRIEKIGRAPAPTGRLSFPVDVGQLALDD